LGIAVLAWPRETLRTLGVLIGIWLTVAGAACVLGAFVSKRGIGRQVLSGTVGVVLLIGGVACLRNVAKGVLIGIARSCSRSGCAGPRRCPTALRGPTAPREGNPADGSGVRVGSADVRERRRLIALDGYVTERDHPDEPVAIDNGEPAHGHLPHEPHRLLDGVVR
jgi:Short repeat of unknown function (DUF308)